MQTALISFLANSINTRILSAYLKQNGFAATCFFCPGDLNPENLKALIALLREKGTTFAALSLVTDNYLSAVRVTKAIKDELGIPVMWGGAHVNIRPDEALRHADMVCMGEGEEALLELHRKMAAGGVDTRVKNIWFKTGSGIIRNELRPLEENLDKYPFPDFDLVSQYVMTGSGFQKVDEEHFNAEYSIMTSRGCPYSCRYCYNSYRRKQYDGKGKYLRTRSIENVIEELVKAKAMFKDLKRINFWDDSFVARKTEDFIKFRKLYKEQVGLPFFALIEPMAFNEEKIGILKECGLAELQIGVQTGSERVNRDVYNRPVSNKKVIEVAQAVHRMGIKATYDFIFNNPYETREDIQETIGMLLQFPRPFSLQGYNLIFYPGTDITERALRDGYISLKPDVEDFSTIQGKKDSPTATVGQTEVSDRLYKINYDSRDKEYLNAVISLFIRRAIPHAVVRYFARPETKSRRLQLKWFVSLYLAGARLKQALTMKKSKAVMDTAKDLISVIVTSYNHAEYLDQRMESLLHQSYQNLEIIVVDDASKDNSLAVLEKYKKYAHIRIVALDKNGGYANASNLGVSLSRGAYIMFAECDDFNAPTQIEVLHDALAGHEGVGVAYCRSHMVDSRGRVFDDDFHYRERAFKALCSNDTMIPKRMMQRFFLIACVVPNMSAALIRKECFERAGGLSTAYKACADWDLWCRLSLCCDFYYVASCLNDFRTHATSIRITSGVRQPLVEIIELLYAAYKKIDLTSWERFRFKLNIGFIWASYASGSLAVWRGSFPAVWRQTWKHDKLNLFYLILGIMKNTALFIKRMFSDRGRS